MYDVKDLLCKSSLLHSLQLKIFQSSKVWEVCFHNKVNPSGIFKWIILSLNQKFNNISIAKI